MKKDNSWEAYRQIAGMMQDRIQSREEMLLKGLESILITWNINPEEVVALLKDSYPEEFV